jgi:Mn-dependent DtxR family transcriptional regulator
MPVNIDEFESDNLPQGPSVPEQVLTFLYRNRDKAFTRSEIATGIEAEPNTVGTALSRLKDRDLVRHRSNYWALSEDLDRVTAAYDLHAATERLDADDGGIDPEAWDQVAPDDSHPSERPSDGGD